MRRSWLILIWAVAFLPAAIFLGVVYKDWKPKHVFTTYKYETTMTWSDGPDVKLSPESMSKLDGELDGIIGSEAPGKNLHYPVVSLGNKSVEVIYISDQDIPETLRKDLDVHILKRLPELARDQANEDQTQ
jgi:hypothetical protein